MVESDSKELVAIRHTLTKFFEDFSDGLLEEFITILLVDLVEIINALSPLRNPTKLYKHHIKKVIFERIAKNEEITRNWNQRPILWLRDEIFSFLFHYHFIVEVVPDEEDQIRISYELGPKAISLNFSLMSDEQKIKRVVSDELYDLLEHEGVATYNNMEDIIFLNIISVEELEKHIEEIGTQKSLFEDEIRLVNTFLAHRSFDEESISKIQEKKDRVEDCLLTFTLSEKLHRIALKIKQDSEFSREIEMERITQKMNDLYLDRAHV